MNTSQASNQARPCILCGSAAGNSRRAPLPERKAEKRGHRELKLFAYAMTGDLQQVETLIAAGADVNALSVVSNSPVYGRLGHNTALMFATAAGKQAMVEFLLAHGADPSLRNLAGETALSMALQNDNPAIATLLQSAMKRWRSANDGVWGMNGSAPENRLTPDRHKTYITM